MAKVPLPAAVLNFRDYRTLNMPTRYSLSTFRAFRLQLLLQFTTWKNVQEPRKTAIYRSRTAALLHLGLHIIPVVAGMVLVVFNMKPRIISYSMSANDFTALQFASKLLEIFIQASIATVVLSYTRNEVLSARKIPLGGLVAPFRTKDISSLWSLELWGYLTSASLNRRQRLVLCLSLPTAIVLAALVGPSGAVLMIPRKIRYLDDSSLYLLNQTDVLFPASVSLSNGTIHRESEFNFTYYQAANGFIGMEVHDFDPEKTTVWAPESVSISDGSGPRTVQLMQLHSEDISVTWNMTLATVPIVLCASGLSTGDYEELRTQQPYVFSDCRDTYSVSITDAANQYVDFGIGNSYLNDVILFDQVLGNVTGDTTSFSKTQFMSQSDVQYSLFWSEPPEQASNISLVGIAATASPPYESWTITTCAFSAYWVTATANQSIGGPVVNEVPPGLEDDPRMAVSSLQDRTLISLDPSWAKRAFEVSLETLQAGITINSRFARQALQYVLALSYISDASFESLQIGFQLYYSPDVPAPTQNMTDMTDQQWTDLANYISSNKLLDKYVVVWVYANQTDRGDPATLAQLEITNYDVGYGYDASSVTVKLSLAVIIVYLIVVISYLVYTLITGNVATSWNTVAELTTLALNSQRPDDLKNTSVGIDTLETFRRPVNIRVNQEESLEIVFHTTEKDGYDRVEPNQKY